MTAQECVRAHWYRETDANNIAATQLVRTSLTSVMTWKSRTWWFFSKPLLLHCLRRWSRWPHCADQSDIMADLKRAEERQ
ncbi:hypothetical protein Plhal703r1_c16g0075501 [Plasmopara halstedii]